jgi:hypothetical protein
VNARTAARVGWSLFPLSVILWVVALVLNLRRPQDSRLAFTTGELALAFVFLLFGWFGALVVSRRPGHPIGWLLCALGLFHGLVAFANEYAIYGLISRPGRGRAGVPPRALARAVARRGGRTTGRARPACGESVQQNGRPSSRWTVEAPRHSLTLRACIPARLRPAARCDRPAGGADR